MKVHVILGKLYMYCDKYQVSSKKNINHLYLQTCLEIVIPPWKCPKEAFRWPLLYDYIKIEIQSSPLEFF
jgi:hypothetical protein